MTGHKPEKSPSLKLTIPVPQQTNLTRHALANSLGRLLHLPLSLAGLAVRLEFPHRFLSQLRTNHALAGQLLKPPEVTLGHHDEPALPDANNRRSNRSESHCSAIKLASPRSDLLALIRAPFSWRQQDGPA
jgi:hypothetical protein